MQQPNAQNSQKPKTAVIFLGLTPLAVYYSDLLLHYSKGTLLMLLDVNAFTGIDIEQIAC